MLYAQNGDRIVTIDSVKSLHPSWFYAFVHVLVGHSESEADSERVQGEDLRRK